MSLFSNYGAQLIALLGTVAVAILGLYQWKAQRRRALETPGLEAKRKAYEGLWEKLEEINITLRNARDGNPYIHGLLKDVNTYYLRNSLYMNDADQALCADYIAALEALRVAVYTHDDADVSHAWERTSIGLPESLQQEVAAATARVEDLRKRLKTRIQRAATAA